MLFICVEYQTPADDPTLLGSPHTVSMYYEVEVRPEPWQVANHYRASNVKCDAGTVVVQEINGEKVERLRAEGVAFHKIGKFLIQHGKNGDIILNCSATESDVNSLLYLW